MLAGRAATGLTQCVIKANMMQCVMNVKPFFSINLKLTNALKIGTMAIHAGKRYCPLDGHKKGEAHA
jgi:hypothetical protein